MAKKEIPKRTFGVGEIDPEFLMRRDTDQYRDGAKRFRNVRALNSGGFARKPGSWWLATLLGDASLIPFYFNVDQQYVLVFSNGRMDAYLRDGTAAGNLTGAPWTADMVPELRWHVSGDTIFVFHRDMVTQVLKRTGASTWSRSDFAFATGFGTSKVQPYYKFSDDAMTLTPSAATGNITLTASATLFVAGHVGTRFRYLEREIQVTGFTSGTVVNATVIQTLPSAQRLTVGSSANFQVGHIVEQDVSGIKGKIFNISDSTHVDVIPTEGTQAFTTTNDLIGPDGKTTVSGTAAASLPALTDWDEQVFSSVRGYAGCGGIHRERFVLLDHPEIPDAFIASKPGQYYNYDLGSAADGDAIFEFFGAGQVDRVRGMVSDENLIILSDYRPFYVAERIGTPITPQNIDIRPFGSSGCGEAVGSAFAGGIVYPDISGKRISRIDKTGDIENPWDAKDISLLSSHLVSNPISAAYIDRFESRPERYAFFANDDGTLLVHHNIEDQNVSGFGLWSTEGVYKSFAVVGSDVFAVVEREIAGDTVYILERFDTTLRLDAVKEVATLPGDVDAYAEHTVRVTGSTYDFGDVEVAADGTITFETGFAGPFQVGLNYTPLVEPLPPEITSDESIAGMKARYTRITIHVKDSGRYGVNGKYTSAYRGGDDLTQAPPLRTESKKFTTLGRQIDPTIIITQDTASPLEVLGFTGKVSFYG